jgi:hypothetical protein
MLRSISKYALAVSFSALGLACSATTDASETSTDDLTAASATKYEVVDIKGNEGKFALGLPYDAFCVVSLAGDKNIGKLNETVTVTWASSGVGLDDGAGGQLSFPAGKHRTTGFEVIAQDGEFPSKDLFTYAYSISPGDDFSFQFTRRGNDLTIHAVRGRTGQVVRTCTLTKK